MFMNPLTYYTYHYISIHSFAIIYFSQKKKNTSMHNKNEQFVPDTPIFQSPAFPSASCHVSFSITNSTFSFVSILKKTSTVNHPFEVINSPTEPHGLKTNPAILKGAVDTDGMGTTV